MLEGLAAWVLNTYVGEYVENLNTAQLSIALLQGAVELENLPLKKDAFKSLDIPIEVKSGFIGKIRLNIPLRRLRSEPWVISIEKLYLVAGPLSKLEYNEEEEKKKEQDAKKAMLDALEEKLKIYHQRAAADSSSSSWFSYGASVATNIVENIQLNVKDVHIRYEDNTLNPSCPFAAGIVVKNLSLQSTDASWTPKFVSQHEADSMFKLVDLQDFGIYCDTNVAMLNHLSMAELANELEKGLHRTENASQFQDHSYILMPITAQAKVTKKVSALPLRSPSTPRITAELTLGELPLTLSTEQFQSLNLWLREFSRHGRRRRFRRCRPSGPVSSCPKEWWHFAQQSHLNIIKDRNNRCTKAFMVERAQTVASYSAVYSCHLKGETLSPQQKTTKNQLEENLTFEELKLIREAVCYRVRKNRQLGVNLVSSRKSPSLEPTSAPAPQPAQASGSLFQRWFPGWSGWSSQPSPADLPSEESSGSSGTPETESPTLSQSSSMSSVILAGYERMDEDAEESELNEDKIEQEIEDVIKDSSENSSFLRKDTVFACMKFLLKKATFRLVETKQTDAVKSPLVELQCSTIGIDFESRPRTSAMKFSLSLGSLVVLNQTATKPVFTHVIYPQSKDVQSRALFSPTPVSLAKGGDQTSKQSEFFRLVYEKNPSKIFKYSLSINSQPLDIIYVPEILHRVKDLFTVPVSGFHRSAYSLPSWQFEKLRKQTQEELKNTLDQLMEGKASHWSINLDICAPKFVIPENVTDSNPQLMVLDLGNFRLKTLSNLYTSGKLDGSKEDDEDKFETPLSTPPNETEEDKEVKQALQGADATLGPNNPSRPEMMSDILFRDKLYEKYGIELTEMQVVVGHLHDNWRHAYVRGTSLMHIVDRFSISIQLDRRLIVTSDSQWPTAKVSGNLPSLTFHLNEWKIQALQKCMERLSQNQQPNMSSVHTSSFDNPFGVPPLEPQPSSAHVPDVSPTSLKESSEDNKLVVLQFLISSVSMEVQSQGQALIELQVTGVRADLHTKPCNTSLALTVHSLLLVDALQTYGQDFELLVASHKNVMLDSRSGSIRGSELNSPMSPLSPSSPASPSSPIPDLTSSISFSSFQSIQDAISNAFHSVMPHASHSADRQRDVSQEDIAVGSNFSQSKALILLEYEVITTPGSHSEETNRVLNLQFNSLDFIANQETLVEIMSFVNRTFPMKRGGEPAVDPASLETSIIGGQNKNNEHIHINADFKRLNVMLVRFLNNDGLKTARKVATATISCSRLQAQMKESWEIEGSLGGLHLLDVTPEGSLYQQVVSIGHIQQAEGITSTSGAMSPPAGLNDSFGHQDNMYKSSFSHEEEKNACTFVVKKPEQFEVPELESAMAGKDLFSLNDVSGLTGVKRANAQSITAKFDMASLCYIHCPKFLDELMDCMSEFKDYVTKVATSIKSAATEVAMGMVGVRGEHKDISVNLTMPAGASPGYSICKDHSIGDITNTVLLEEMPPLSGFEAGHSRVSESSSKVLLYVNMESPILVIPRTPNSPQVLLAHLGEILMNNSVMHVPDCRDSINGIGQDLLNLSLTNMNLFSVRLQPDLAYPTITSMSAHLSELTQSRGVPILYDTSVDLVIGKRELDIPYINPDVSAAVDGLQGLGLSSPQKSSSSKVVHDDNFLKSVASVLDVRAKISSPLKLSLSKEVYEQILQTTDNLTYEADPNMQQSVPVASPSHPGLSAKLSTGSDSTASSGHERVDGMGVEDSSTEGESFLAKHVDFEVPLFQVELRGDFGEGEQGLVELKLYDFAVKYEKNDKITTGINVHLKSLQMDDLLEAPDSKHRQIIVSHPSKSKDRLERQHLQPKDMMSTSCPDSTIITPVPQMPPSLPASFSAKHQCASQVQFGQQRQQQPQSQQSHFLHRKASQSQQWLNTQSPGLYPCTPPPSPLPRDVTQPTKTRQDDLVCIDVILVDKKRPEYLTLHNKTNRFIDINFACLDATINLQTWVVLLDFLGLGSKVHDMTANDQEASETQQNQSTGTGSVEEDINSEINFKVESFTLIFNKPEYELAQATAANLDSHISLREGNLWATGQLGSLSLLDQSPNGHLYRQRFMSTGRQLVEFDFFKYGLPDFALQRQYDISLKLRMSSVRYVHTNHFQSEMVAFIQHFLQLQDVLGRMRAASAGKKITEAATRGARILLDIVAASPILLIPHSSETDGLLVADLGNLKLKNQFIVDGMTGTLRASKAGNSANHTPTSANTEAESKAFQKGIIHRGMTESQLNMSYPPTRPLDPMTQSVYGSLDHDLRLDHPDPWGLNATNQTPQPTMKRHVSQPVLPGRNQTASKKPGMNSEMGTNQAENSWKLNLNEDYLCLLDVISVTLSDMDLFPAKRVWKSDYKRGDLARDMEFSTYVVERGHDRLLEEKCHMELHIEHNLEGDVSHSAPDFSIKGKLSSVNCKVDGDEYELVRGILNHNLGEKLEEFRRPLMSHLQDPKIETVLGGHPWKIITLVVDLRNVTVELLRNRPQDENTLEKSLGRFDFIRSQLSFTNYSNNTRAIGLISNEILMYDTRFKNEPVNSRPNVFTSILQPSPGSKDHKGLQVEMKLRSGPDRTHFTCLLNNMRLMCIFDFLLAMREFISKEPPDPFKARQIPQAASAAENVDATPAKPSSQNQSPLTVSRGIITKRGPLVEEVKVPFELVLNFADTQFVVVEDSTSLDTNAVILKNTAVIIYKPQAQDKVLTCSLQSVELFSCCLMAEEDTALSIIDPTGISVELNANPLPQPTSQSTGLLGLRDAQRRQLVLEVNLKTLNIRVSYHDMVMFLAIMNSLPMQAKNAQQNQERDAPTVLAATSASRPVSGGVAMTVTSSTGAVGKEKSGSRSLVSGMLAPCASQKGEKEEEVEQLMSLGFSEGSVRKALAAESWNVEKAAIWLTENAEVVSSDVTPSSLENSSPDFMITAVEFNADGIVLCLIDDCGDADIPLVEVSCNGIVVKQDIIPSIEGKASFQLLAEYYNRRLSGWEPCLEPWRCLIEWKQYLKPERKLAIQLAASDVLNLNVTSTLLELYEQTRGNWTQDYLYQHKGGRSVPPASASHDSSSTYDEGPGNQGTSGGSRSGPSQRRSPFIPYVLRNDTGCNLWFLTATTTPSNLSGESINSQMLDSAYIHASDWKRVSPGETRPFHFHRREKLRHQKTHAMHVDQLLVTVEGWQRLFPVSVDKVGTYFRHADPDLKAAPNSPPARIVFEVQQEGGAKKLIIVRSALVIQNELDSPIELRMESTDETGQYQCMTIPINQSIPVPLSCINARLRARPSDWPVHFCTKPLDWHHVKKVGDKPDGIRHCALIGSGLGSFSFFVCVTRLKFPEEGILLSSSSPHSSGTFHNTMPGHVLSLLPPLTIQNMLPLELHYYLRGTETSGNLKAGKEAALHGVDMTQSFDLGIHLENFPTCKELNIPPHTSNRKVMLRIFDNKNRLLKLIVRIHIIKGGSMRLTILAPFWLVNKSGIPLVFRQDGSKQHAAGQFEEHEQARSMTPLLFSFPEVEEANLCQMRIGTSLHGSHARPQWCSRFSLEGGTSKRTLHVIQVDGNRPDWLVKTRYKIQRAIHSNPSSEHVLVYTIGIQVSQGRGRYRGTNIVSFASHCELDNQSGYKLAIAQHFMTKREDTRMQSQHLIAMPQCILRFHWPRVDLDQLLCVKILDISGCRWSGGFYIDKINSFHINMRDASGKCHLLKVEVVQEGPTFFVVFADADVMPPPFRIDNFSEVPVMYYQSRTLEEKLKAFIQPLTSIPYAWDEPTVRPLKLTLSILGGTSASYSLDKLEEGEQLHYENFIYLAATATFDRHWDGHWSELVLDCVHNHNIVFKRKEKSKRSQLWRMTGLGMLEHEGSMPPRDPRNSSSTGEPGLVLDIADLAPRPGQSAPLILRKPDARRRSTQTWRFTEQGQLCCLAGNMCVQAVGGVKGLQDGAIAILGVGPNYQQQQPPPSSSSIPMTTSYPSFPTAGSQLGPSTASSRDHQPFTSLPSVNVTEVPCHMLVSRQKLRPGSGCVSVKVTMDGPIRVIELLDIQQRRWQREYAEASRLSMLLVQKQVVKRLTMEKDLEEWEVYDEVKNHPTMTNQSMASLTSTNIELSIALKDGIGVSLVNGLSEELLYVTLKNINVEVVFKPSSIRLDTSIAVIQADNQIKGAQRPVAMFVTPLSRRDVLDNTPALHISAVKVPSAKWKAQIFKHLYVSTKRMTIHLEEQLLWKLMQFAGLGDKDDRTLDTLDETHDNHRALSAITSIQATRFYFGTVKLSASPVTLSMVTASKLTSDLKVIKNAMSMTLIAFEQAHIDMRSFEQYHMFETGPFLLSEIKNHYKVELISQAAKILGSVDFLGNPLGLVHDITEGITGLVKDGNITGLVKNVTHGVSNSTAKVMSSLSDGISTVGLDEDHNSRREALRNVSSGSSSEHLMAGFKGLSHGILGGVTSLVSQSISGAQNEGFGGLIKGVGKGVIGTVTKPVSGVLDLTSGLANALRDSSTRTSHRGPGRLRAPRCTQGPGGLLTLYLESQANAQTVLYELNDNDFSEYLIAMEQLMLGHNGEGNMHVLITSRQVYFLNQRHARHEDIVLKIRHADLLQCTSITADGKYYIELIRRTASSSDVTSTNLKRPRVRCEKQLIAKKVAQEIKYAKNLYDERAQTLEIDNSSDNEDW